MYRAVAWAALDRGIDPADHDAVSSLARSLDIDLDNGVRVDDVDVTRAIRTARVDETVSVVAANPEVRTELVATSAQPGSRNTAGVSWKDVTSGPWCSRTRT